jgi:hypothetical protein
MHVMVDFRPPGRVGYGGWDRGRPAAMVALLVMEGNDAMVERTDPTMEEIVVALRETTRDAGRPPPLTVIPGRGANDWTSHGARSNGNQGLGRGYIGAANANKDAASTDVTDLRDAEIERLLADNARCNERIMFLLKIVEHEQARDAAAAADTAGMDRAAILRDVKASIDAELRPVLLLLQRLIEKQQLRPAGESAQISKPKAPRPGTAMQPSGWITDMSRELEGGGAAMEWKTSPPRAGVIQLPNLRQRIARAFEALCTWSGPETPPQRRDQG